MKLSINCTMSIELNDSVTFCKAKRENVSLDFCKLCKIHNPINPLYPRLSTVQHRGKSLIFQGRSPKNEPALENDTQNDTHPDGKSLSDTVTFSRGDVR